MSVAWRSTRAISTRLAFMLVHSCSADGPPGCATGPVPFVLEARCEVCLSRLLRTARPGRGRRELRAQDEQRVQGPAVVASACSRSLRMDRMWTSWRPRGPPCPGFAGFPSWTGGRVAAEPDRPLTALSGPLSAVPSDAVRLPCARSVRPPAAVLREGVFNAGAVLAPGRRCDPSRLGMDVPHQRWGMIPSARGFVPTSPIQAAPDPPVDTPSTSLASSPEPPRSLEGAASGFEGAGRTRMTRSSSERHRPREEGGTRCSAATKSRRAARQNEAS